MIFNVDPHKRLQLYLTIFMLLFAITGQICFSILKDVNLGISLYLFSFLSVVIISLYSRKANQDKSLNFRVEKNYNLKLHLQIAALVLFVYVIYTAYSKKDTLLTFLIWCLLLALYVLSFLNVRETIKKINSRLRSINRIDWLIMAGIMLLASFLRIYELGSIPKPINQEEGFAAAGAMEVTNGTMKGPFEIGPKTVWGWTYYSGLYYYGHALFVNIFGLNMTGNRMFAAVSGIIAVLITMAIARAVFNKRIAYISGVLVALMGVHIHFSRFGFPFIQNALFGAIVILLLVMCEKKRYMFIFALAGISIGIAQYTWSAARVLMAVAVCYLIFKTIQERNYLKNHIIHISAMIIGFIFAFLPYIVPFQDKIPNFIEGAKRDFIFGGFMSPHKDQVLNLMDKLVLLKDYSVQALLEFNFYPDIGYCYAGPGPMLPFVTSILFAIGLFYLITMWKKPNSIILLLLFFGTIVGLVALTGQPNYQRAVVLLSLPPIFAALGIDRICDFISNRFTFKKSYLTVAVAVLLTFVVFENYNDYFNIFMKKSHDNPNRISRIAEYIKTADPSYEIYMPDLDLHGHYLINIYIGNSNRVHYGQIDKVISKQKSNPNKKSLFILFESITGKANIIEGAFAKHNSYNLNGDDNIKIITVE